MKINAAVSWLALVAGMLLSPESIYSQGYDQLKTQLMFENFYGSKMRSTAKSVNVITGSETLLDDWHPIEIEFENGSTRFEQGKVNLFNTTAEVLYKEQEMFIATQYLKRINLPHLNRWLIPAANYKYDGVRLEGFLEVFKPELESPSILVHHYVYIKQPSTNGYVSGGTTDEKFVKSSKIYIYNDKDLEAYKGKKTLERLYSNRKQQYFDALKQLTTDFKNPKSVQTLMDAMHN